MGQPPRWSCPRCGANNMPQVGACHRCGAAAVYAAPVRRRAFPWWTVGLAGCLAVPVVGFLAFLMLAPAPIRQAASAPPSAPAPYIPDLPAPGIPIPVTAAAGHVVITWMPTGGEYTAGQVRNDGPEALQGLTLSAGNAAASWTAPGSPQSHLSDVTLNPGQIAGFALAAPVLSLPSGAHVTDAEGRSIPYAERFYRPSGAR